MCTRYALPVCIREPPQRKHGSTLFRFVFETIAFGRCSLDSIGTKPPAGSLSRWSPALRTQVPPSLVFVWQLHDNNYNTHRKHQTKSRSAPETAQNLSSTFVYGMLLPRENHVPARRETRHLDPSLLPYPRMCPRKFTTKKGLLMTGVDGQDDWNSQKSIIELVRRRFAGTFKRLGNSASKGMYKQYSLF